MKQAAPLSGFFAIFSILGFVLSAVYIAPNEYFANSETWGFAFMVVFGIMFVASMISAVKAPIDLLDTPKLGRKRKNEVIHCCRPQRV